MEISNPPTPTLEELEETRQLLLRNIAEATNCGADPKDIRLIKCALKHIEALQVQLTERN